MTHGFIPTLEQAAVFSLLALLLGLFIWGRWRFDVVALAGLLAAVLLGLVPAEGAFVGFGHNAVITVALVLVLSRGLSLSGAVDMVARVAVPDTERPIVLITALAALAAVLSAFMNNVGALALLMPVAMQASMKAGISPAVVLMPVSFGSILGGMTTMIGTPPNIIIASYRGQVADAPFAMFDFTPVGVPAAIVGVLFVALIGWRLLPADRRGRRPHEELFDIGPYLTEVQVPEDAKSIGRWLYDIDRATEDGQTVALIRSGRYIANPGLFERIAAGDIVVLRADPEEIKTIVDEFGLALVGERKPPEAGEEEAERKPSEEITLAEAVVMPGSLAEGRNARALRLRQRYGLNLLAVSRGGEPVRQRLRTLRFQAGDVLLLQGETDRLSDSLAALGCAPLAERGLRIASGHRAPLAAGMFVLAIALAAFGILPIAVGFALAVLGYVVSGIMTPRQAYQSIEWPVIVLLGALIPIGGAMEATGAAELAARALLEGVGGGPIVALVVIMVLSMTLSDVMNNAATALVMAPIAVGVANLLGASIDPFLLAVAIGSSCAFLTPIGHQNNTLILGPGGYRFGDYWRMGLPLEIIVIAVAVPLLLTFWPL